VSDLEEIKALLALQQQIDGMLDQFITRVKAILDSERDDKSKQLKQRIIAEIDGEIYELVKISFGTQAVDLSRKHRGFFHDYRIVKLGKPMK